MKIFRKSLINYIHFYVKMFLLYLIVELFEQFVDIIFLLDRIILSKIVKGLE